MEEIDSLYIDGNLEYTTLLADKKWKYFKGLYCLEVSKSLTSSQHFPSIPQIWNFLYNLSQRHHQYKDYLFPRPFDFTQQHLSEMKQQITNCSIFNYNYRGYYDSHFEHF
jgi:hypothetical protein